MATVAVDNRQQHPQTWQFPMPQHSRQSFRYLQPPAPPPAEAPLPPRNEKELTREMLVEILTFFSTLIPSRFNGAPVRLVVHGGACMLLHPGLYALAQQQPPPSPSNSPHNSLPRRTTTRDVDYINRSFAYEWHSIGVSDATERLKDCMKVTAQKFRLGLDWMNSDADVALPMANDPTTGQRYDPIYTAALQPNNVHLHTVFTSPNGMLTLVSVTPFWSVALKLVRYTKWDPGDICLLLRNGTNLSGTQWSTQMIEGWLFQHCWPMGYGSYDPTRMREMKLRIVHAMQVLSSWDGTVAHAPANPNNVTADAAMGGSGDASSRTSIKPGFIPPPPAQIQHEPPRWMSPAQHPSHAQGSSTRKPNPSLAQDEWQASIPMPRPKSHSHSHAQPHAQARPHPASTNHSAWRPPGDEHVRQFDSHIASMLRASAHREVPSTEPAVIPTMRRRRDRQRDAGRKRDRFSKWLARDAGAGVVSDSDDDDGEDSDDDDDDEWRPREKSGRVEKGRMDAEDRQRGVYQRPHPHQQQQQQQYHHQSSRSLSQAQEQPASRSRSSQQQPQQQQQHSSQGQTRPPAWHLYAQPQPQHRSHPPPPQSQPLAPIDPNRRARSRSANPLPQRQQQQQHRPPPLDLDSQLEPLDGIVLGLGGLAIFK